MKILQPSPLTHPDILRKILCYADDRTLVSCMSVSWAFWEAASTFLYRHIRISPDEILPFAGQSSPRWHHLLKQVKVLDIKYHDEGCTLYDETPLQMPNLRCLRLKLWPSRRISFCRAWYMESRCSLAQGEHERLVIWGAMSPSNYILEGVDVQRILGPKVKKVVFVLDQHDFSGGLSPRPNQLGCVEEVVVIIRGRGRGSWWDHPYLQTHDRALGKNAPMTVKRLHLVGHDLLDLMIHNPKTRFIVCGSDRLDHFGNVLRNETSEWWTAEEMIMKGFERRLKFRQEEGRVPDLKFMGVMEYLERGLEDEFTKDEVTQLREGR